MDDAEALGQMHSTPIKPDQFDLSRFGRPSGPADGEIGDRTRGDNKAMQDSTLTGLRAMLQEHQEKPRRRSAPVEEGDVPASRPERQRPVLRETNPAPKATLLESGDIMQNTAFGFMVTVQELTEDGGFLGRGAGVGRIRVRGTEMQLYKRVGKGV